MTETTQNLPRKLPEALRERPELGEWCILAAYRGSVAHGMYVPSTEPESIDDIDVMAVCVPPLSYYFGLDTFHSRGTLEIRYDEWDIVVYELRKFIGLLAQGNPNVLALLWTDPHKCHLHASSAGAVLGGYRGLFVGKHVYKSFVGYANGQLKRMTRGAFQGYMGKKRKALVERLGYDAKNAAHLIRLLRMGIEFLDTGELIVERPDADELLQIKRGEWPLEAIHAEAARLFQEAKRARDTSPLPERPDKQAINNLCVELTRFTLKERGELDV